MKHTCATRKRHITSSANSATEAGVRVHSRQVHIGSCPVPAIFQLGTLTEPHRKDRIACGGGVSHSAAATTPAGSCAGYFGRKLSIGIGDIRFC